MLIRIPIPVGRTLHVTVQGQALKVVACEHCQQQYAYLMHLQATGTDFDAFFLDTERAARQAHAQAEEALAKQSQNKVLAIPCPNCGFYQEEMVRRLKDDGAGNGFAIAGLAVIALSLIPLAFSIPNIWILTVVGVVIGAAMMVYADVAAMLLNPNAGDPEPRKALGRQHALWGERLAKLLAMNSNADQVLPTDETSDHGPSSGNGKPA